MMTRNQEGKNLRILWISPRWPLPPHDGATRATHNLLSRIGAVNFAVDLLAIVPPEHKINPEQAARELNVERVFVIERTKRSIGSLLRSRRDPITYAPFHSPEVLAAWERLSLTQKSTAKWDGFVYDGLHAAALFCRQGLYSAPPDVRFTIYRSHNFEAHLWQREAERARWPTTWPLRWQGSLVERFESSVISGVDLSYAISTEDQKHYGDMDPRARVEFLPVGFDFDLQTTPEKQPEKQPEKEQDKHSGLELIYVGRLDWPPNRNGLEWFLRKVWPEVRKRRQDVMLSIVGHGASDWLQPFLSLPGLKFHGRVEDLAPYYERANASIIPVFYGSGVRVKVLEASYYARPCLSSEAGAGGSGLVAGEHYVRAETENEWIDAICGFNAENLEPLGAAAYHFVREKYDANEIANRFRQDVVMIAERTP